MSPAQKIVMWVVAFLLAAYVTYFGFTGYLQPELLISFANLFSC